MTKSYRFQLWVARTLARWGIKLIHRSHAIRRRLNHDDARVRYTTEVSS